MFGKGSRKPRTIVYLLVLAALAVPGASGAATPPSIVSATVFGNLRPGDPSPETDPALAALKTSDTLFANSRPFGFRYEHGIAYVEGRATGDLTVDGKLLLLIDIVATDGIQSVTRTVTVQPVNDPEINKVQGEFRAQLDIWNLGTHTATAGQAASNDTANWGGTVIDFRLTPRATDGTLGATEIRRLTKYAGTPRDTFAPQISKLRFPPSDWCHLQGRGAEDPFFGFTLGGTGDGYCGDFSPFVPFDPTWAMCAEPIPGYSIREQTEDPFFGTGESLWANQNFCQSNRRDEYMPSGHAIVSGHVDDHLAPNSLGIASDIATITIQVWQGEVKLREVQNIDRQGAQANFGLSMNINDFEPTSWGFFDLADPYIIKVVACDAWSNCTTAESGEIRVYPY